MAGTSEGPGPFGLLLQQYRAAAGLSQEELAEKAGLSRRGISDLERGERRIPHPATARRLADALGLEGADRVRLLTRVHMPASSQSRRLFPARPPTEARVGYLPVAIPVVGRASELTAWLRAWTKLEPGGGASPSSAASLASVSRVSHLK
jgi:transcriptional regulator with XRE-family HTH domain